MKYVDLATTTSGDIIFTDATKNNSMKLSFDLRYDDNEQLILSFRHHKLELPDINNESLKLNIDFSENKNTYKAMCISDKEVINKRIEYIIRTTVTDLKENTDFGSDMELYMHKNIRDKSVISDIESLLSKALSGVVDMLTVKVKPYVSLSQDGYFQGIIIDIFSYNEIVFSYTL